MEPTYRKVLSLKVEDAKSFGFIVPEGAIGVNIYGITAPIFEFPKTKLPPTEVDVLKKRIKKLEAAINWACGCSKEGFGGQEGEKNSYWWRSELAYKAGLKYNGKKCVWSENEKS